MTEEEKLKLEKCGFRLNRRGGHSARTIMIEELELLFQSAEDVSATKVLSVPRKTFTEATQWGSPSRFCISIGEMELPGSWTWGGTG